MESLTKIGYDNIIEYIVNREVTPPKMNVYDMHIWLSAYAKCQNDIIDIIKSLKNDYGR